METVCGYEGNVMRRLCSVGRLVLALIVFQGARAQTSLTAAEILLNVERRMSEVKDYIVDVQAEVDMERMRIPRMKATMYFKYPDKVHFESPSFAMLPREGVALNPSALRRHYDASLAGHEDVGAIKAAKLQLAAKEASTRLRQMFIWVDTGQWTIVKMETIPYTGRVVTISFLYALIGGKYWMAQSMEARFDAPGRDTTGNRAEPEDLSPRQLNQVPRQLRSGTIRVEYANYRINTGLKDEIFERKESQNKN